MQKLVNLLPIHDNFDSTTRVEKEAMAQKVTFIKQPSEYTNIWSLEIARK